MENYRASDDKAENFWDRHNTRLHPTFEHNTCTLDYCPLNDAGDTLAATDVRRFREAK